MILLNKFAFMNQSNFSISSRQASVIYNVIYLFCQKLCVHWKMLAAQISLGLLPDRRSSAVGSGGSPTFPNDSDN